MRSTFTPIYCNLAPWVALTFCAGLLVHRDQPALATPRTAPATSTTPSLTPPEGDYIRWLDGAGATMGFETAFELVPHLDIKPGDCPNPLKVYTTDFAISKVPMSILGNAFDVTQVDLASVHLTVADIPLEQGPEIAPYQFTFLDTGTPFNPKEQCDCEPLEGDEELDLSMNFNRLQMIDVFELDQLPTGTFVELRLTGTILGGKGQFSITDCVRISNLPE